jgi:hypothetical protein
MGTAFKPYLTRGIPSTAHVEDRETARVLDALKDALRRLEQELQDIRAEKTPAAEVSDSPLKLSAGKNITLAPMSGGYVISAVDQPQPQSAPAVSVDSTAAENPGAAIVTLGVNWEDDEYPFGGGWPNWTAGGAYGLKRWYISRIVYNPAGHRTLYAFFRYDIFDKYGRLYEASSLETRVAIEVAEAHPV